VSKCKASAASGRGRGNGGYAGRWVRFANSLEEVNRRQRVSTGVNLCQPRTAGNAGECTQMRPSAPQRVRFSKLLKRLRRVAWRCMALHGVAPGCTVGRGGFVFPSCDLCCPASTCVNWPKPVSTVARESPGALHRMLAARKSRPLSLPSRCAFVVTNAQRARAKRAGRVAIAEFNFENEDFPPRGRCAFLGGIAQRAS